MVMNKKVLLLVIFGLLVSSSMQSQSLADTCNIDTVISLDAELSDLFEKEGLLQPIDYDELPLFQMFNAELKQLKHEVNKGLISKGNTTVMIDNYYYIGDSSYLYPRDVVYSSARLQSSATLVGIPINASGSLAAVNGKMSKNFSTFSVSFDSKSALKAVGKKFLPSFRQGDSFLDLLKHVVGLSPNESKLLKEELKTLAYQRIIAHPKYNKLKDSLYQKRLSLMAKEDSLLEKSNEKYKAQADSIQMKLEKLKRFEAKYYKLWEEKGKRINQLGELEKRLGTFGKQAKTYSNPDKLRTYLLRRGTNLKHLKFKDKLAILVKGAGLGLVTLDDREYTCKNLSVTGGSIAYESRNFFTTVGYGKQNLSRSLSIFSDRHFANRYAGNNFLFVKAGIGQLNSDYVQVSYLRSSSKNNSVGSRFILPKNNIVIATALRQFLTKNSAVTTDIAISKQDPLPIDIQQVSVKSGKDNMAFSMKTEFKVWKDKVGLNIGYFQVGPNFFSSGNPFLLTNRKGILGELETRLWKDRVKVNGRLNYAVAKVSNAANTVPFRRFDFSGAMKIRIARGHSVSVKYAPSQNFRSLEKGATSSHNYFYLLQSNSVFKLTREKRLVSIASFTNLQSRIDAIDTTFSLDNSYCLMQESFVIGKNVVRVSGMVSSQDYFHSPLSDYLVKAEYQQNLDKLSYNVGASLEERRWDTVQRVGIVTGLRYNLLKSYSVNIQSTLRHSLGFEEPNHIDYLGQVSIVGRF